MREECETTVLATQDDARQGELQPSEDRGRRARAAEGHPRAGARAPHAGRDRIEVEAGFMKMQVSLDDVVEVLPEAGGGASKLPKNVTLPGRRRNWLLGAGDQRDRRACARRRVERVEQFLDRAVMATAGRVRIVHGHGMGILRKAHLGAAGEASARREVLSGAAE